MPVMALAASPDIPQGDPAKGGAERPNENCGTIAIENIMAQAYADGLIAPDPSIDGLQTPAQVDALKDMVENQCITDGAVVGGACHADTATGMVSVAPGITRLLACRRSGSASGR